MLLQLAKARLSWRGRYSNAVRPYPPAAIRTFENATLKATLFRGALVIGGTILGLVIVEVSLRVAVAPSPIVIRTLPYSGWDILQARRNSVQNLQGALGTFDERGFRAEGSSKDHAQTVLFLGDSFTAGNQVADGQSLVAATERSLHKLGLDVGTINAGSQGIGTSQELDLLQRLLETMQPEVVVLVVFPGNDLLNNIEDGQYGLENGRLVAWNPPRRPFRARMRLALATHPILSRSRVVQRLLAPLTDGSTSPSEEAFELERLLLLEFVDTAQSKGIPTVIAVAGTQENCLRDGWWRPIADALSIVHHFARTIEMVQAMNVVSVDLCNVANKAEYYDKHYTPAGNSVVGAAIAARLVPLLGNPEEDSSQSPDSFKNSMKKHPSSAVE